MTVSEWVSESVSQAVSSPFLPSAFQQHRKRAGQDPILTDGQVISPLIPAHKSDE